MHVHVRVCVRHCATWMHLLNARETKPPGEKMVGFFCLCVIAYAGAKWWVDLTLPLTLTLTLSPSISPSPS